MKTSSTLVWTFSIRLSKFTHIELRACLACLSGEIARDNQKSITNVEGWDGPGCPRPGRESLQNLTACFLAQLFRTVKLARCAAQSLHRLKLSEIRTPQRKLSLHMCSSCRDDSYAEISAGLIWPKPCLTMLLWYSYFSPWRDCHVIMVIRIPHWKETMCNHRLMLI
jgi:hypothetical protein